MTEQQRREQIMKARQQATMPAAPSLSDTEAMKIASGNNGLTQEQMIAIAMFGKIVQNDVNGIKKAGLGDLKVSDVDMSKVMPSGIVRASGISLPPIQRLPVAPAGPAMVQPVLPSLPTLQELPSSGPSVIPQSEPSSQLEFDFDKKARYEDVIEAIEKLEKKINIINEKVDQLLTDKKKLLTNENPEHGN